MLRFPDCFLVGAPRCGTTSMSYYLREHPQICFSDPKETHFFTHVWRRQRPRDLRSEYLETFFAAYDPRRHRAVCEGSVSYLYDREALERILVLNPGSRFLVMVRDPFELLPSYHQRMVFLLQEDVTSFAAAWQLQERRARGDAIPTGCVDPYPLLYREVGRLGARVAELFELAGRERCHVVVFDDLISDPRRTYLDVLRFLGLEDDGRLEFRRHAESKGYRRPPGAIVRLVSPVAVRIWARAPGRARLLRPLKRALRRQKVAMRAAELSPRMKQLLRETFAEDVARLGGLIDRDLSHWLGGSPAPVREAAPPLSLRSRDVPRGTAPPAL